MRIALTGASGMLGGACLRQLAARGDQDRKSTRLTSSH